MTLRDVLQLGGSGRARRFPDGNPGSVEGLRDGLPIIQLIWRALVLFEHRSRNGVVTYCQFDTRASHNEHF